MSTESTVMDAFAALGYWLCKQADEGNALRMSASFDSKDGPYTLSVDEDRNVEVNLGETRWNITPVVTERGKRAWEST